MGWRCRGFRTQLALLIGDDLSAREKAGVEFHLNGCPSCREYLASLRRSREARVRLHHDPRDSDAVPSLWPTLESRLNRVEPVVPVRRSWLPIGAMAAASVAMATIIWNRSVDFGPSQSAQAPANDPSPIYGVEPVSVLDVTGSGRFGQSEQPDVWVEPVDGRSDYHLENARPVGRSPQEF